MSDRSASYRAILAALVERGPCSAGDAGCPNNRRRNMACLVDLGHITRLERIATGKQLTWIYEITKEGRAFLATEQKAARNYRSTDLPRFTATQPPWKSALPRTVAGCTHHWHIENDLVQSAKCAKCEATKEFRPTFGMDLSPVGKGKVTASERLYA